MKLIKSLSIALFVGSLFFAGCGEDQSAGADVIKKNEETSKEAKETAHKMNCDHIAKIFNKTACPAIDKNVQTDEAHLKELCNKPIMESAAQSCSSCINKNKTVTCDTLVTRLCLASCGTIVLGSKATDNPSGEK